MDSFIVDGSRNLWINWADWWLWSYTWSGLGCFHGWRAGDSSVVPEHPGHALLDARCLLQHPTHTNKHKHKPTYMQSRVHFATIRFTNYSFSWCLCFSSNWCLCTLSIRLKSSLSTLRKWQLSSLRTIEAARGASFTKASLPKSSPSCSVHTTP